MLKLKTPFMEGPAVSKLQEIIGDCKVDGIYGPETEARVRQYQESKRLTVDGVVGPMTWASLLGKPKSTKGAIIDIRDTHAEPRLFDRLRDWSEIDSVTLHQTGCNMPKDPAKWKNLNAHYGITTEGKIVWCNDETFMIWHAQGLSKRSIGIEFEGNLAGVDGKSNTVWKGGGPETFLTKEQQNAAAILLTHLIKRFDANDARWDHIFAHRQSSKMRAADPGSAIWQTIAMPWAQSLGLGSKFDGGPRYKKEKGLTIPREWDASRKGKFFK